MKVAVFHTTNHSQAWSKHSVLTLIASFMFVRMPREWGGGVVVISLGYTEGSKYIGRSLEPDNLD